jgi:hypothetical protein
MNYYPNYFPSYHNQPSYAVVNGIEDAKSFIVNPNCTVFLRDSNSNMCFEKWADAQGRYNMKIYNLVEVETNSEYIKHSDLNKLEEKIDAKLDALCNMIKTSIGGQHE